MDNHEANAVLVISDSLPGRAMLQTVKMFGFAPWQISYRVILALRPAVQDHDEDGDRRRCRILLRGTRCVIAQMAGRQGPREVVALLHLLRGNWLEEAVFVAIAPSVGEAERLAEWNLFGEPGKKFQFRNVAGHAVLPQPLRIVNLLTTLAFTNPLSRHRWMVEYAANEVGIFRLRKLIADARQLLASGQVAPALSKLREATDRMADINWATILPNHEQEAIVAGFRARYPKAQSVGGAGWRRALDELEAILQNTMIGGK